MTTLQDENFPYFIVAPDYRDSSAGVQVMHRLCHMLNERGRQAWMLNCSVNPEWNTPTISGRELMAYRQRGGVFITIYPEVVSGNVHQAPVVVRYMLNREGVINGNSLDAHPDDIFFWFRPEFAEKTYQPRLLNLEFYDLELFKDDGREKNIDLLYLNRVPVSCIDFSTLPPGIEILSMQHPLTLQQLAEKLKCARTFYTFESSGTALLAILCGAPVVALSVKGYEKYALTEATLADNSAVGFCWDDRPETLHAMRQNLWQMREILLKRREQTDVQIETLVQLTQQAAKKHQQTIIGGRLENWLVSRHLAPLLRQKSIPQEAPRLLVAIFDDSAHPERLDMTLATLRAHPAALQIVIITQHAPLAGPCDSVSLEKWPSWLAEQATRQRFDWLHCLPAGSFYTAESWPGLARFIVTQKDSYVIFADELWLDDAGLPQPHFKPAFNWDLFSASPTLYLKRGLISCAALQQFLPAVSGYPLALEAQIAAHVYMHYGEQAIRHFTDVLCMLPAVSTGEVEWQQTQCALEKIVQLQGYPAACIVAPHPDQPMQILYGHDHLPLVSLIILAGNSLPQLERCVTRFLQFNNWPEVELLVVNHQHDDMELNRWLDGLASIDPLRIRVMQITLDWQPIKLRNIAAQQARGEFLLFVEAHIIFIHDDWLTRLMNHGLRAKVGLVGPKLIDTEQQILSAGLIAGYRGVAEHIGQGERWDSFAMKGYLQSDRLQRLLDGQCLLIRTACWQTLDGLDETFHELVMAELDFALKANQAGFETIWTPHSVVASDERPRGINPFSADAQSLIHRWGRELICDPGYHPYFSLDGALFSIDEALKQKWLTQAQVPLVVFIHSEKPQPYSGRLLSLLQEMASRQLIALLTYEGLPLSAVLVRLQPDLLIIAQDAANGKGDKIEALLNLADIPVYLLPEASLQSPLIASLMAAKVCHRWLVFSEEQKRWLEKRKQCAVTIPALVATPDCPPTVAPRSKRLRAFIDTREMSGEDARFFHQIVATTSSFIDWIVWGAVPEGWMPFICSSHRAGTCTISLHDLDRLQLNIAVLFRLNSEENRFKDDYLLLQLQAAGIPALCSDIKSLTHRWHAHRVRNKEHAWIAALHALHLSPCLPPVALPDETSQLSTLTLSSFWQCLGLTLP